jgi:triosephosphate isomerase
MRSSSSFRVLVDALNDGETLSQTLEVIIAPGFLHLGDVATNLKRTFEVAAQDCSMFDVGAYTGDTSATQLRDFGLNWVILGHSERRSYHGDTDEIVALKMKKAISAGLRVVACIGETLEERKSGRTAEVVLRQVDAVCSAMNAEDQWWNLVLAYEPVWAIGKGSIAATPEQAQEVHATIRSFIEEKYGARKASKMRIIYGGSVKPKNSSVLFSQPDIDGFLVGGASLIAPDFLSICKTVQTLHTGSRLSRL